MDDAPPPASEALRRGLVTCRAGLEPVVAEEIRALGLTIERVGRRAVFFQSDLAGVYRANLALRAALNVLLPIRTFNARNYDLLYFQSRKTNWHKLFPVDTTLRIDVNGGSDELSHSEYVIHRVKDGIVDTFRKLHGRRPSVDKRAPDVHVVVHLDGTRVTLCLDTSGLPLFKRGYRQRHGEAPLKEDLAAGLLLLSGWDRRSPLLDPMCGSGTLCCEAWMIAANLAPNLGRDFSFQTLYGYRPDLHQAEKERLAAARRELPAGFRILGCESDRSTWSVFDRICRESFPDAPIERRHTDFRQTDWPADIRYLVANPPYGVRLGTESSVLPLYTELGRVLREKLPSAGAAVYTANPAAPQALGRPVRRALTLYNGALEGRLLLLDPAGGWPRASAG